MPPGPDPLSLHGRVALVTGAGRGIGAATARALAQAGAAVMALDRDPTSVGALVDELRAAGADAEAAAVDVTDDGAVRAAVERTMARWGRLDVLVNNAGIVRDATLAKVTDEDWATTQDVNLRSAMVCARAAVPHMRAAGRGRILSASSVVARSGNFGQTAYVASKAGIIGLTRVWARELGPHGITANAVAPGYIDTPMLASIPEAYRTQAIARIPAGRAGRPEEVAAVYLFLASDLASFMNGAVVGVDGGQLL
jgi:3-oxoacyl-[acyl-carrier protein] reductase